MFYWAEEIIQNSQQDAAALKVLSTILNWVTKQLSFQATTVLCYS